MAFARVGSGPYVETPSNVAPITQGTRAQLSVTFTVPAGATEAFLRYYHGHSSGVCYWDQVGLYEGSNGGYFDGNTVDPAGNYVYALTGTPHQSQSTRTTFKLLNDRIREVITENNTPVVSISSITWNAQEAPALASTLEVQDRIKVEFRGRTQNSRVVGIKHDISPDRWLMHLELVQS